VFHLLLALADQERHGYAIMRDIEERTGGLVRVGPGMLYGSIKWLLEERLIEESARREPRKEDERRKYYRLTADGLTVVTAEAARLEAAVGLARARNILARRG
jgi:DNA-binding PadR family transcriptional regulator